MSLTLQQVFCSKLFFPVFRIKSFNVWQTHLLLDKRTKRQEITWVPTLLFSLFVSRIYIWRQLLMNMYDQMNYHGKQLRYLSCIFLKRCGSNRFSMQFHLESIWETESRTTKGISRERKQSKVKSLEPKNNDMTRNGVSLGLKKCLALNPFLLFHVWQEACISLALDTVLSRESRRQTDSLSSSFLQSLEKHYFPCHPFRLSSSSSASSSISFWPRFRVNDEWKAEKDVRNLPEY